MRHRADILMWGAAVVVAGVVTAVSSAAGARLGAALTGGVIVLTALIIGALVADEVRSDRA